MWRLSTAKSITKRAKQLNQAAIAHLALAGVDLQDRQARSVDQCRHVLGEAGSGKEDNDLWCTAKGRGRQT